MQFVWTDIRPTRVTDPDGKHSDFRHDEHVFGYGRHRLTGAMLPSTPATQITYHYEDTSFPGALTSLSYAGVRHSSFAYDSEGRPSPAE